MPLRCRVLLLLSCLLVAPAAGAADPWKLLSEKDGLRIERRPVDGSPMPEVRVTVHSPLPVSRVIAAIWSARTGSKLNRRYNNQRQVLRDDGDERLVYQKISAPIVSERDYTVRMRRRGDGTTAPFQATFELDNDAGPPPLRGVVRLTRLRGSWTVTAAADGGSDVVYACHSEPGGSIPAFLVRGPFTDSARDLVVDVLEWAASHP